MWYPPTVTQAASDEPVSLDEAKLHCRVDGSDEDDLIEGLIAAARGYIEDYTGTTASARTVEVKCDSFADFKRFPVVPLNSVSEISYIDPAGEQQSLSIDTYEVRSDGYQASLALKAGKAWPAIQAGSRIAVTANVGATAEPVKQAMLLLISDWYDHRGNTAFGANRPTELPHAVTALLTNHRVFGA